MSKVNVHLFAFLLLIISGNQKGFLANSKLMPGSLGEVDPRNSHHITLINCGSPKRVVGRGRGRVPQGELAQRVLQQQHGKTHALFGHLPSFVLGSFLNGVIPGTSRCGRLMRGGGVAMLGAE